MSGIFSVKEAYQSSEKPDSVEVYLGGMKVSKSRDFFSENKCYFIISIIAFVILYIVFPILWVVAPSRHALSNIVDVPFWIIGGLFVLFTTLHRMCNADTTKVFMKNQMTIGNLVNAIDQAIKGSPAMCLRVKAYHEARVNKHTSNYVTAIMEHPYRILTYRDLSDRISSLTFLKDQPIFKLDMKKIISKTPNCHNQMTQFEEKFKNLHKHKDELQASETTEYIDGYLDKTLVTNVPKGTQLPWYASESTLTMLDIA